MKKIRLLGISGLFVLAILIMISGCVDSIVGSPEIRVEGSWRASGLNLLQNPVTIELETVAINTGDLDAKNVQATVVMEYFGKEQARDTIYFGTVKVGFPVTKQSIIKVHFSSPEWANFDKNGLEMKIVDVKIGN